MEKISEVSNLSHIIKLSERKNIIISGVKKINNFAEKEFNIDTIMGGLNIKGENLEMIKLDTIEGNVSIKGKINQVTYTDVSSKENSILMKLFKWFNYY